ncbi:MAG: serine kinase [Rhodobacteraceae bacterium]|nr:serine kinase [Paracoccaceae bacterium]
MPDSISAFAITALDRAEKALKTAALTRISVAGVTVGIAETAPKVVNWLSGQFDPPAATPSAQVFCDYSGGYLPETRALGDLSEMSPLAFDEALATAGLFGSFDANQNRWDLFDPARNIGVRLLPHPGAYPEWEPTAPLANLLGWIMRAKGRMVMHAASLGIGNVGILLAGPGGSGKSGTTLAGVANGLQSVGDDYCVVSPAPSPVARPLYRMMKQDSAGLARVGINGVASPLNWQGKHVFDLREVFPEAAIDEAKIKAILLPRVSHLPHTKLERASAFEALQALAPSTMLQLGGDRSATFKACAEVVRAVPAFHLLLSEDPREIAATIRGFILEGGA